VVGQVFGADASARQALAHDLQLLGLLLAGRLQGAGRFDGGVKLARHGARGRLRLFHLDGQAGHFSVAPLPAWRGWRPGRHAARGIADVLCCAFKSRKRSLVAFKALAVSLEPAMIFFSGPVILSSAANTTCSFKSRPAIYSAPLLCLARSRQAISSSIVKPSIAAGVQWKTPAMSAMASSTSPGIPKGDRLCSPKNRRPRRPRPAGRPGPCWQYRARSRLAR